tara:strand:+ start:294 stop:404 length:111 start_codon:yes stop_codon:yes gene_type:complete
LKIKVLIIAINKKVKKAEVKAKVMAKVIAKIKINQI